MSSSVDLEPFAERTFSWVEPVGDEGGWSGGDIERHGASPDPVDDIGDAGLREDERGQAVARAGFGKVVVRRHGLERHFVFFDKPAQKLAGVQDFRRRGLRRTALVQRTSRPAPPRKVIEIGVTAAGEIRPEHLAHKVRIVGGAVGEQKELVVENGLSTLSK